MLKRMLTAISAAALTVSLLFSSAAPTASALVFTPTSTVYSEAAVLLNLDTDTICYEKNADKKEMPAMLTQILTAVVVLENCSDLSGTTITAKEGIFDAFADYENPNDLRYAGIEVGDSLTAEDLLYAMLLTSSCEAAVMLADHFGSGNQENFVKLMNDKAEALGMKDSRFSNATGLYAARQVATARDMMTLLKYAMELPRFEAIACAANYTPSSAAAQEKTEQWAWKHSNVMMESGSEYHCNGVRGIKTGNLQEGGRCIACKASRDGNNYLLVCMNAPMTDENGDSKFYHLTDAKGILDWAFTHLSYQEILSPNKELDEILVNNAKGADYVIVRPKTGYSCMWCDTADISSVQQVKGWEASTNAPVQAGDKLGVVTLKLSGETLAEIDVIAASTVERSFWKYNLAEIPGFLHSKHLHNMLLWAIILSLVYLGLCIFSALKYRAKHRNARDAYYANRK